MKKVPIAVKRVPIAVKTEMLSLSMMCIDPKILSEQPWDVDYFAMPAHRIVFEAIQRVHQRVGIVCPFAVVAELESENRLDQAGGEEEVHTILSSSKLPSGKTCQNEAMHYRHELREAKAYRDVIALLEDKDSELRQGRCDLNELSETIMSLTQEREIKITPVKEIVLQVVDEMEGKVVKECFATGLLKLDRTLKGGIHRGELMTIASETGGGKSIELVQASVANLLEGKSVVFFSLEMSAQDILTRMACNIAGYEIREPEDYKNANQHELMKINSALLELSKLPLEIVDDVDELQDILSISRRFIGEKKADVIVIDYIQIISFDKIESREGQISEITRQLKVLAQKNKVVVMTASQLNDEGRLRESRAIGQHSNQVVYIEHIKEKSRIVVKKNRRGQKNYSFDIKMRGEISKLEEIY
jgi:replicative DNA helicase